MNILYKDLKFYSGLFLDYIYNFNNLTCFFKYDPFDPDSYKRKIQEIKSRKISSDFVDILIRQNLQYGNEKATKKFESLNKKDYLTIITGQQAGLFGGPLYTLYKILTAVKLSEFIKVKYKIQTVVIFWVESDDHDFDEISKVSIFNNSNEPVNFKAKRPYEGLSVGQISIKNEIKEVLKILNDSIPDSEFKNEIIEIINSSYVHNERYSAAFSKFLLKILNCFEILVFDPNKKEVKNSTKEFFHIVKDNLDMIDEKLRKQSDKLKSLGYHNQVKVQKSNTNLFIADPERHNLKYNSKIINQLDDIIEDSPELLSTNVFLRPILQDFIFPDTAYIAGPSEIAYFAQIGDLYELFGISMPIVFPRASFTILNKHCEKMLDNMLQYNDLFKPDKNILEKVSYEKTFGQIDKTFRRSENTISQEFDKLINFTNNIDFSLGNSLSYSKNKTISKINDIKDSLKYKINLKDEKLVIDLKKFKRFLLPFGGMQERNISLLSFLIRYGFEFPKLIYDEIELFNKNHKFIKLI
ncbi:bacillithiol biosynthesis cysteine-adding enzyme BshC [candidate division KSB1 bacterium]